MKKLILWMVCLFALCSCSQLGREESAIEAEVTDRYFVTEQSAAEIAQTFFRGEPTILVGSDGATKLRASDGKGSLPTYYIYTTQQGGFVIVSATEVAYPILGYSREGEIDMDNLPCGLEMMLGGYSQEITQARRLSLEPNAEIKSLRAGLKATDPQGDVVVASLLGDINWDQMPYYNALCPAPQVPVGCVATATSQIMRFWEYPERAKGHHSYRSKKFGVLSHDFNYALDWAAMPKTKLDAANYDIARFCYGVAVSMDMNFDYAYNGGSGTVHGNVPSALIRFYGYPKMVTRVARYAYSDEDWLAMMKNELDHGRPIQYGGSGKGGGHSFVLDGYDDADYFHVNWGWGGQSNGWFKLDAMNPDELGTGGGDGGFNNGQDAVINIAPPQVVLGDNNEPIKEDTEKPEVDTLEYPAVTIWNPSEIFIRYTNFNGVVTYSQGSGYTAYLSKSIRVPVGGTLNYEIEPVLGLATAVPAYVIAVDYNRDGKFDIADGTIELPVVKKPGNADTFKGSFQIPESIGKGIYRMRIYLGNDWLANPNKNQNSGEYEDYQIVLY